VQDKVDPAESAHPISGEEGSQAYVAMPAGLAAETEKTIDCPTSADSEATEMFNEGADNDHVSFDCPAEAVLPPNRRRYPSAAS
jgi:hypothetical protein